MEHHPKERRPWTSPITVWIDCYRNCKTFANSWPSASNFKSFSSGQFFRTVSQNNFGNKIPFKYLHEKNNDLIESYRSIIFQWNKSHRTKNDLYKFISENLFETDLFVQCNSYFCRFWSSGIIFEFSCFITRILLTLWAEFYHIMNMKIRVLTNFVKMWQNLNRKNNQCPLYHYMNSSDQVLERTLRSADNF